MSAQILLNGLSSGTGVALLAVAFYLAFIIGRTFHVALAGVYALAPFIFSEVRGMGYSAPVSVGAALLVCSLVSGCCESLNHHYLRRRGASEEGHLLSSLGLYVVLVQAIIICWGPEGRLLRQGIEPAYGFFGLVARQSQIIAMCSSVAALLPLAVTFYATRWGLVLRAFRDSPAELALLGYDENKIRLTLFGVAGCLAGIAALIDSMEGGFQAHNGFPALLLAVVAALAIRGESLFGVIATALGLGLVRAEVVWMIGARWQDTFSYGLFAVALVLQNQRRDELPMDAS